MTRTDNETTLTIYSIVENSKPFQNRLGKVFFDKICDDVNNNLNLMQVGRTRHG